MAEEIKDNNQLLDELYQSLIGENEQTGEDANAGETEGEGTEETNLEPSNTDSEGSTTEETSETEDAEVKDDESLFEDWDSVNSPTSTEEETVEKEAPDYTDIGKVLGIEDASKEKIVEALKKVKESADVFGKLPNDLGAAVKLALEGKDYSEIFRNNDVGFDHSLYDDETLLKHEYAGLFKDDEGNIDVAELNEYIESLDPIQKKIESKKVRQVLDAASQQKKQADDYNREQEFMRRDHELRSTLDTSNDIKGFKLTSDVKKTIYEKIASGEAVKDMFYNDKGEYDMSKVVESYFIYQNFDKIKRFLVSKAKNEVKRDDFNNISNAQVNTTSSHTGAEPEKPATGVDLMLEDLLKRNGLKT